ncbi:hypothetical protein [Saccharicrinis aurantiacus]|uniref:hypothetical protein n=1 Tax=Saccharicrinis aurantiacus TaxID=1849719 RepID=UPI00094F5FA4|nr:hypothetical protein [Saccharicrinis aurantiacus]
MDNFQKFEGIDYVNNFAVNINSMHQLVASNLTALIDSDNLNIIDIGGGPGIGAKIIDKFGKRVKLINVEPSNNIDEIPDLNNIDYSTLKLSFKDALKYQFPWKADVFLMISAAHEISLSNSKSPKENKEIFFQDIKNFLKLNSRPDSIISIGFPNYRIGVTTEEVLAQRKFVDSLMGHSHPPEEFFTIDEFKASFSAEPILFEETPMILTGQTENETKLIANFAVFRISDIQ